MSNKASKPVALIVEDDDSFSTHTLGILQIAVPKHEYRVASSVKSAKKIFAARSIVGRLKVVLLDLMLPADEKAQARADELSRQRELGSQKRWTDEVIPVSRDKLIALREKRFAIDQELMALVHIDGGIELLKQVHDSPAWAPNGGHVIVISARDLSNPHLQRRLKEAAGKLQLHF
ncbi:MAG TPA: hypothetical protein VNT99_18290, partial [Methylomirabilota bacterium]|nr:hypothetical protein [Methylomirabilota bacterium]